jgi:putative spermidine/putrescine transport system permease protein
MRRGTALLLLAPAVLLIAALLGAPLAWLVRFSVHEGQVGVAPAGALTLAHYAKALGDGFYLEVFARTLGMALVITLVSAVVSYPLAHFMWQAPRRWRAALTILALSPLLVSIVVSSYGWMVILGDQGVVNRALLATGLASRPVKLMYTDLAIVVGLVHIVMPFMTLSILAALERIDPLLGEAAATLGAPRWRILWHVTLPLALPGIAAGTTIVFSLAISSYVTPAVLGPSGSNFITTLIWQQFTQLMNWSFGSALAALLLALSLAVVFGYVRLLTAAGVFGGPGRGAA